jgi:iron complex outermembrane receptor protein
MVRAEIVQAYELGYRARLSTNFSFTLTAYYNDYDHLRSVEPTTPVTFGNGVRGRSQGLEAFADWQATRWWRVRIGGFVNEQDTWRKPGGADLEQARGEESYPGFQFQMRNSFTINPSLSVWTSLRRVGEVSTFEAGVASVVPAYTEFDATLRWTVRPSLTFTLGGRNLLEPYHAEIGALAVRRQIPRSVFIEAQFKF